MSAIDAAILSKLEEEIFQHLSPPTTADDWRRSMSSAVSNGADLSCVGWLFLHWLLTDSNINPGINNPLVSQAVAQCAKAIMPLTCGLLPTYAAANAVIVAAGAASSAAYSAGLTGANFAAHSAGFAAHYAAAAASTAAIAAAFAADSAAYTAAYNATADFAANIAVHSAANAAWSVGSAVTYAANSGGAAWPEMSRKLIELVKKAPKTGLR